MLINGQESITNNLESASFAGCMKGPYANRDSHKILLSVNQSQEE
jgi:hypothetical protein